ncbi:putative integral membrane protein, partial [Streptomyces azureus]
MGGLSRLGCGQSCRWGGARPEEGGTPQRRAAQTPRPQHRHPAPLHPGAWWLWSLSLGTAATRTTN